ncbi:hypothetical protein NLJ89_g7905 [Agrocybe chaxingu]|uniref:Enoyl reductase (ER) domain-containing protein n=1 Tax=Agrocybe chaxingu TaxID=84603 RepID=A0A9W8JW95_9AGAR|nr:hypothetical protein NLJ89_g7905 [Agrocybe chaxingu]
MAQKQIALLLEKGSRKLVVGHVDKYKPGFGEILIKIQAVALNPVDWKVQKSAFVVEQTPAILGLDIAGDVDEVGEGVTEFKEGDRVFCQGQYANNKGGFQQYTLALAATTAKIPPNVSYDGAASIPAALSTAYVGLYNRPPHGAGLSAPLTPTEESKYIGEPIIVLGGGGSVGQLAIQLARLSGFSPIIATASLKHTQFLKSLGATHILDRNLTLEALKAQVDKITAGKPIKIVYDAISLEVTQKAGLSLVTPGGKLILVLSSLVEPEGNKTVVPIVAGLRAASNIQILETLYHDKASSLLERGVIKTLASRPPAIPPGGILPQSLNAMSNETQRLDDTDPAIVYSEGWGRFGSGSEYNTTTTLSAQAGTTATLAFKGSSVSVYGTTPAVGNVLASASYAIDDDILAHTSRGKPYLGHYDVGGGCILLVGFHLRNTSGIHDELFRHFTFMADLFIAKYNTVYRTRQHACRFRNNHTDSISSPKAAQCTGDHS